MTHLSAKEIADRLRERMEEFGKRFSRPKKCEDCGVNLADPPSKLCPGCQVYKEHQQ